LWAAGRQILGLSENEFWSLSPRELSELFRLENKIRKKEKTEADFRAGVVASTIANVFRNPKKKKKAYRPQDFMPQEKKEVKQKSWKDQLKFVEKLNDALGGQDKRGGAA